MNKVFAGAVTVLALGAVSAVSAIDLSVGGGGYFGTFFGGGIEASYSASDDINIDGSITAPYTGGGVYGFFDARYVEISIGYFIAGGTWDAEYTVPDDETDEPTSGKQSSAVSLQALNIGVLGKYPIALGGKLKLFPEAGIDYQICLSGENKGKDEDGKETVTKWDGKPIDPDDPDSDMKPKAGDFSAMQIKFGAGLDYALTGKLFIRPELLYGVRFASKSETDQVDKYNNRIRLLRMLVPSFTGESKTRLGHGLLVKVGIGYTL